MSFASTYGRWAVVAGASDGVGEAFAQEVARRGLDVVLIARRRPLLESIAEGIERETGAQTRVLTIDLASPGAADEVIAATEDVEVGLLMYNAGGDPNWKPFLDNSLDDGLQMLHRNCAVPTQLCHHYGRAMVARGRGGLILVTSGAALGGTANMAAYGGSKAWNRVFAEALWAELKPHGVYVLSLLLGETDTPALRKLRADLGNRDDPEAPLPNAVTVDEVVEDAIAFLPEGPSRVVGQTVRDSLELLNQYSRREIVELMTAGSRATMLP
jgi:short-subunit dehydrogenase